MDCQAADALLDTSPHKRLGHHHRDPVYLHFVEFSGDPVPLIKGPAWFVDRL
jgi:hypothetical protein